MADLATIGFRTDTRELRTAQRELDGLAKKGKKTNGAVTLLTRAMAGLAAAAGGLSVISKTIQTTSKFSQAVADLSAITGSAGRDLRFFREQAADIGRTTSLSASQAANAFKLIASAQPQLLQNAEALNEVTRSAVTLAEATGETLPASASALGSALNQFQLDASQADEVINLLAASAQLGTAEVGNVTQALRNAGPAAQALGVDLGETVAGIQALAAAGRQGSDAGTGLRQVLLRLEKTGDQNLQPSVVGLTNALAELESRNLSNTDLMELFGDEAFAAATAILGQRDVVERLNRTLRGTNTAYDQASTRMDTLEGDTKQLRSSIEGLAIAIGEAGLEDAVRKSTQSLTEFFRTITEFVEGGTIETLTEDINNLQERLNEGGGNNDALEQRIERLTIKLQTLKAQDGDIAASVQLIDQLTAKLDELEQEGEGGFVDRVNAVITGISNEDRANKIRRQIRDLQAGIFDSIVLFSDLEQTVKPASEALDESGNSAGEASEKYRELTTSLSEQLAMLEMTERQAFIYQETAKLGEEATTAQEESVRKLAGTLYDETKAQEAATKAKKEAKRRNQEYTRSVEQLERQLDPAGAAQSDFNNQIHLLNAALLNGDINFQRYLDLVEQAQQNLDDFGKENTNTADQFKTAWERGVERVDDIFADLWESVFNGFDDFGENLKRSFNSLLAEMAHAAITRPIVLSITGGGGLAASGAAAAGGGASGGAGMGGIGGSGVGVFDAIRMGFSSINSGIQQSIATLGVKLYDFAPAIGDAIISNAGFLASAPPFAGAAISLFSGDIKRGVGQGIGAGIGTTIGGPIGGFIGSALGGVVGGLFGGKDHPRRSGGRGTAQFEDGQIDSQMRSQAGRTYEQGIAEGTQRAAEQFAGTVGGFLQAFGVDGRVTASAGYGGRPGGSGYGNFSANVAGRSQRYDNRYHDDFGEESFEQFLNRVVGIEVRRAIQSSGVPEIVRDAVGELPGDPESVQKGLFAILQTQGALAALGVEFEAFAEGVRDNVREGELLNETLLRQVSALSSVNGLNERISQTLFDINQQGAEAASSIVDMLGGLESFNTVATSFYRDFAPERVRVNSAMKSLAAAFSELGETVPKSTEEYYRLVQAQDLTTASGRETYAALLALSDTFLTARNAADRYRDKLAESAAAMVSAAEDELTSAYDALVNKLESAHESQIETMQSGLEGLREQQQVAQQFFDTVRRSRRRLFSIQPTQDMGRGMFDAAQAELVDILARARSGDFNQDIQDTLRRATDFDTDYYASFADYQRDFNNTARTLKDLEEASKDQLSDTQLMLNATENRIDQAQSQHNEQLAALEEQYNASMGIDDSVKSIEQLMREFVTGQKEVEDARQEQSQQENETDRQTHQMQDEIDRHAERVGSSADTSTAELDSQRDRDINDLYNAILGRDVLQTGIDFYADSSASLEDIAQSLRASSEAQARAISPEVQSEFNRIVNEQLGLDVPGFANGGAFRGGMRVVGERGPEPEMTGPSRIVSNGDMRDMMSTKEMTQEIKALRAELNSAQVAIIKNTSETARALRRWNGDGLPEERNIAI